MGPNHRALEREAAAARAAEEAKRAEAKRKSHCRCAEDRRDLEHPACRRTRALVLPDDRRGDCCGISMVDVFMPGVPAIRISRSAETGSPSGRIDIEPDPVAVVPAVFTEPAVCKA
jgi:hypothetical protein